MADVESLELRITGDASKAKAGLDALIGTLDTLKLKTQGGCGLTSIANQVSKMAKAAGGLNGSEGSKLESLAKGLNALSNVGNLKLSPNIAHQISSMGSAFKNLDGADFTKIKDLAVGLAPLETLGKSNLGSVLGQIKKLPEVAAGLNKADLGAFNAKIKELTASLKPLADEMQKVANGFSAFPAQIQKFVSASSSVPSINTSSSWSFKDLASRVVATIYTFKRIARVVASWINTASEYRENLNLFTVSMGEYAKEAMDYANTVGEVMGIDPSEWIRNQSIFMTLATGFGVVGDRANEMSQNLTKLGYDLSSYYNLSVEETMQKVKSGFAGELEPLRNLGYDLSQAKLEAIALGLGIDKAVSSMTQAEKAELRYYAVMTQVTQVQGDMARTLNEPANQLRILRAQLDQAARAMGNLFIPILRSVLPYLIAFAKVLRIVANTLAGLFKVSLPEIGDAMEGAGSGSGDLSENLDDAVGSASKLKKILLGIDELNVMSDPSSGKGGSDVGTGGFNYALPEYKDFIGEAVTNEINGIVEKMKEWAGLTEDVDTWSEFFSTRLSNILETVGGIAVGIAAWKISTGTLKAIEELKKLSGKNFSLNFGVIGAVTFLADLDKLKKYFEDFVENGATFSNVTGMLSEFTGLVGDAMIALGKVEIAGPLKVVQGVGEIASAIADISETGLDAENAMDVVRGISNIGIAIGAMTKDFTVMGLATTLQGVTGIVHELAANWEAIKEGDWSEVDKATLVISAVEVIGGLATALGVFNKIKDKLDAAKTVSNLEEVATVTTTVNTTTSNITTKLTDLVKNLGLGIAIIAEVAAAAALFVGAIWLLGVELEQVGIAWEPVIANGETVLTAVGIGTGILVGIGAATALLGSLGGTMCAQIGIGIAMLAEIGVAAGLFIIEIWAIGKGLDEIGKAWEPVFQNGEDIAKAIGIGTGILVAVGAAAGLLGVAATSTAGLLPLAIGLGTAMLVELGVAAGLFIIEIWAIGEGLDKVGQAWGPVLDNGEDISEAIKTGTKLLIGVGAVSAALGVATVASAGLLPIAVGLGTAMLVDLGEAFIEFTDSLIDVANQLVDDLHPALVNTSAILPTLSTNMTDFTKFMKEFANKVVAYTKVGAISGIAATVDTVVDFFTTDPVKRLTNEVEDQGKKMSKLVDKLNEVNPIIKDADRLMNEFNGAMEGLKASTGIDGKTPGSIGYIITIGVQLAKSGWTSVKDWLGDFSTTLKIKLPHVSVSWIDTGEPDVRYPKFNVSYYAQGGFPTVGQMFIANEAGPELVGSIGNRTAVVNNDQIVESVSQGVYRAVVQAMGSSRGDQVVEAKVNDKVLFEVLVSRARQETVRTGHNPLLGGV